MEMQLRRLLLLAVLAGLSAAAPQEYRLRVTVDLVQVDATVTDAQGNPVPDLNAGDFRVLLDGKPQALKYCIYITLGEPEPPTARTANATEANDANPAHPPQPAGFIKREDMRRTIVLFVGDLLTSAESMPAVRAGLKKFLRSEEHTSELQSRQYLV